MPDPLSQILDFVRQWLPVGAGGYAGAKALRLLFDTDTEAAAPCHQKVIRGKSGFVLNERLVSHVSTDGRFTIRALRVDEPVPDD